MAKRKVKLTRKRADWVGNRKVTLRGEPMRVNESSANKLAESAMSQVYKMHLDVNKQVMALFDTELAKQSIPKEPDKITTEDVAQDGFAMDASISVKARHLMNKLIRKWEKHFNLYADNFADSMIKTVTKQSSSDLKKAGEKLSGGMTIKTDTLSQRTKDIIYASTDESSSLIKTLASNYTASVKEAVSRSIASNTSSLTQLREEIHAGLQDKYKVQRNKAKNVALDQTRKAYSNIGASKMQDAGLDQYIWRHSSGSQRPRSYHRDVLAGKVFSLSNPPVIDQKTGEKGKPGDAINCKCFMDPVITFG